MKRNPRKIRSIMSLLWGFRTTLCVLVLVMVNGFVGLRLNLLSRSLVARAGASGPNGDGDRDGDGDLIEIVPSNTTPRASILRRIDDWACVSGCGACCKLGPMSSRPDIGEYLTPEDLETYTSMVGDDDWCVNFDKVERKCPIYETRPTFCHVSLPTFKAMYDIQEADFSDFCSFCCREQISDVYGEDSEEMENFEDVLIDLSIEKGRKGGEGGHAGGPADE